MLICVKCVCMCLWHANCVHLYVYFWLQQQIILPSLRFLSSSRMPRASSSSSSSSLSFPPAPPLLFSPHSPTAVGHMPPLHPDTCPSIICPFSLSLFLSEPLEMNALTWKGLTSLISCHLFPEFSALALWSLHRVYHQTNDHMTMLRWTEDMISHDKEHYFRTCK